MTHHPEYVLHHPGGPGHTLKLQLRAEVTDVSCVAHSSGMCTERGFVVAVVQYLSCRIQGDLCYQSLLCQFGCKCTRCLSLKKMFRNSPAMGRRGRSLCITRTSYQTCPGAEMHMLPSSLWHIWRSVIVLTKLLKGSTKQGLGCKIQPFNRY